MAGNNSIRRGRILGGGVVRRQANQDEQAKADSKSCLHKLSNNLIALGRVSVNSLVGRRVPVLVKGLGGLTQVEWGESA